MNTTACFMIAATIVVLIICGLNPQWWTARKPTLYDQEEDR